MSQLVVCCAFWWCQRLNIFYNFFWYVFGFGFGAEIANEKWKKHPNDSCLLLDWICFRFHISHSFIFNFGSARSQSNAIHKYTFALIDWSNRTDSRSVGRTDVCWLFRKWWNWHTFPFRSVNSFYMCASVDTQFQLLNSFSVNTAQYSQCTAYIAYRMNPLSFLYSCALQSTKCVRFVKLYGETTCIRSLRFKTIETEWGYK